MARKPAVYTIDRPDQIAALASPVRHVIVDALTATRRPCSVSQIAELIGRPADSLYYHLRSLEKVGLILQVDRPGRAERDTAYYTVPGRTMRIRYDFGSPAFRRDIARMMRAMLRVTERDFARAAADPSACGSGRHRNTWVGRAELRLSPAQLESANRLIRDLFELQQPSPSSGRSRSQGRYALMVALTPIRESKRGRPGRASES